MAAELDCNEFTASKVDWDILRYKILNKINIYHTQKILDNIISFEGFPDFETAIKSGRYKMSEVVRIRNDKHINDFRMFMNKIPVDIETSEVLTIYRGSYEKNLFNDLPKKLLRFGLISALVGVGAIVAGSAGSIAGIGIGAADTFLVDKLLNGWNPRVFLKQNL